MTRSASREFGTEMSAFGVILLKKAVATQFDERNVGD